MAEVCDCVASVVGVAVVDQSVVTDFTGTGIGTNAGTTQIMITFATEQIGVANELIQAFVQNVHETVGAGTSFTQVATTTDRLAEVIGAASAMHHVLIQLVEQSVGALGSVTQSDPMNIIAEHVGLLSEQKAVLMHRLAEVIGVSPALATPIIVTLLADGVGVSEVARPLLVALNRVSDGIGVQSATTARAIVTMLLSDGLITSTAATQVLEAINRLSEEVIIGTRMIDNRTTGAWTVPSETMAMSRYEHPDVIGMAGTDQGMLAIGSAGLYLMTEGQPDHGDVPVIARVLSGKVDLIALHRPSYAYAHRAQGHVRILVSEFSTAAEVQYGYPTTDPFGQALKPTRVNVGRGMRSRTFRFGFENIDGEDFRVQTIVYPLDPTSRKV